MEILCPGSGSLVNRQATNSKCTSEYACKYVMIHSVWLYWAAFIIIISFHLCCHYPLSCWSLGLTFSVKRQIANIVPCLILYICSTCLTCQWRFPAPMSTSNSWTWFVPTPTMLSLLPSQHSPGNHCCMPPAPQTRESTILYATSSTN